MLTTTSVFSQESPAQVRAGVPRTPHAIPVEDQEEAGTLQSSGVCPAPHKPAGPDVIPISQRKKLSHYIVHAFGKITECLLCAWMWGHIRGRERAPALRGLAPTSRTRHLAASHNATRRRQDRVENRLREGT